MVDDSGGSTRRPVDRSRRALRPVYRRPAPPRPARRPVSVWLLSLLLGLLGTGGVVLGLMAAIDAADHGEQDGVVALIVARVLVSLAQVVTGTALFFGAKWGRTGSLGLCGLGIAMAVVAAIAAGTAGPPLWIPLGINLVLTFALLGPQIYAWTGGDGSTTRPAPARRPRRPAA